MAQLEWWERVHQTTPTITLGVGTSPVDADWIVRVDGWTLPPHFAVLYMTLEAAQRAADDILLSNVPHDCRQRGCGDWRLVIYSPVGIDSGGDEA